VPDGLGYLKKKLYDPLNCATPLGVVGPFTPAEQPASTRSDRTTTTDLIGRWFISDHSTVQTV
jgi:hypothetical protein